MKRFPGLKMFVNEELGRYTNVEKVQGRTPILKVVDDEGKTIKEYPISASTKAIDIINNLESHGFTRSSKRKF